MNVSHSLAFQALSNVCISRRFSSTPIPKILLVDYGLGAGSAIIVILRVLLPRVGPRAALTKCQPPWAVEGLRLKTNCDSCTSLLSTYSKFLAGLFFNGDLGIDR